jgi:hypothetical protein
VPLRFQRRVRIAKGFYLNVGKRGITSVTVGQRGASTNISKKGTRQTYSLPGTGISYQTKRKPFRTGSSYQAKRKRIASCGGCGCVLPLAVFTVALAIALAVRSHVVAYLRVALPGIRK